MSKTDFMPNHNVNILKKNGENIKGKIEKVCETYLILEENSIFDNIVFIDFHEIEKCI